MLTECTVLLLKVEACSPLKFFFIVYAFSRIINKGNKLIQNNRIFINL